MQLPPIAFSDLTFLLAVGAIVLLIIAELSSSSQLKNLTINKKKLRNAALATGVLFLITVGITIIGIITGL